MPQSTEPAFVAHLDHRRDEASLDNRDEIVMATRENEALTPPPKVEVLTTLPLISSHHAHPPKPIHTDRLILRPLGKADLEPYHLLRKQPDEPYGNGRADEELQDTEERLRYLLGTENYTEVSFGIFLKRADGREGELIGEVGADIAENTWPGIFYGLKKEHWGNGYGTEFAKAFVKYWWSLPRTDTCIQVDKESLRDSQDTDEARELLCAGTELNNRASHRVLEKAGFEELYEVGRGGATYLYWGYRKE